jgi:hypothetical protein
MTTRFARGAGEAPALPFVRGGRGARLTFVHRKRLRTGKRLALSFGAMKLSSWSTGKLLGLALALFVVAGGAFLVGATLLVVAINVSSGTPDAASAPDQDEGEADTGTVAGEKNAVEEPESKGIFGTLADKASRVFSSDAAEQPRFEGNRPIGLYLMTRFWIATSHLEKAVWYFTSDGRVYLDPEGITPEQLAAHKGRQGTVSAEGENLTVQWSDGKQTSSKIEREGGPGFAWDTGIFAPMKSFGDPSELHGQWEGGESVSFSGSSSAVSRTLDIKPDGTFTRVGVASLRSESNESVASAGASGTTSGRWSLDGYTLTFTYGNGDVVRGVSFPFDDEKTPVNPDRFYFGGTLYKKQ